MRLDEAQSQRLRALLEEHSELSFALLFGSMATGEAGPASDIDIAVVGREVATDALAAEVSLALGRETDVVRVERATIPLLEQLLRDGVLIVARASRSRTTKGRASGAGRTAPANGSRCCLANGWAAAL